MTQVRGDRKTRLAVVHGKTDEGSKMDEEWRQQDGWRMATVRWMKAETRGP